MEQREPTTERSTEHMILAIRCRDYYVSGKCGHHCEKCDAYYEGLESETVPTDTELADRLEQLQRENAELRESRDKFVQGCGELTLQAGSAIVRAERAEKERDAAIELVPRVCYTCGHWTGKSCGANKDGTCFVNGYKDWIFKGFR